MDILFIDETMRKRFNDEEKLIPVYRDKLKDLEITKNDLQRNGEQSYMTKKFIEQLDLNIEQVKNKIFEIESRENVIQYDNKVKDILKEYIKLLEVPKKISFFSKKAQEDKYTDNSENRKRLINKFYDIISSYLTTEELKKLANSEIDLQTSPSDIKCDACNSHCFEEIEDTLCVCENCGVQKDVSQININDNHEFKNHGTPRYAYDRRVHFKDCINQYQGKQNSTIHKKVYEDLEKAFEKQGLLIKADTNFARFKNITREHVSIFLKELGYSKHYENVNLIHYNLTGIKPDDISHLEEDLMKDFDILTETYDRIIKSNLTRTNFINTQYVLYQLLQKHKHPCKKEDFVMLKTIDRQCFHDEIMEKLFESNGWNIKPIF